MNSELLRNPTFIQKVLEIGLKMLLEEAKSLGAVCGVGGVGIVVEGELQTKFAPLDGDWSLAYDADKQWDGESEKGINYLGFAMGKMAQSVRTKEPSTDYPITRFDYGESNDDGSFCEAFYCDGFRYELHAVFSGLSSADDKRSSITSVGYMRVESTQLLSA